MSEPSPITVPQGIPEIEAATPAPKRADPEVLIITGMSGAGRTRAAGVLEDLDWFVVDNLPPMMIVPLVDMMTKAGSSVERLAVVVDVRGREYFGELAQALQHLHDSGVTHRILFLDARDDVLVRRYESVRRPHPLQGDGRILDGIEAERRILASLAERADVVVDTSELSVHDLAKEVRDTVAAGAADSLRVNVVAFGFKYGLPLDADHVVDVRFLANPYWITELRHLTGQDEAVRQYVLGRPGAKEFIDRYVAALEPVLAGYLAEEKRYVTIAVGCTGGKHRSVAIAGEIADRLRRDGQRVTVTTRDLGKE
ncbi:MULTISPECIES: RNase adapter RapZ [Isoptericola]|uniref:RNase adapter RapZ n=1 Tax=Isoptericola sediminis TaxID=2733572 RepID=A0A849K299_9MICO|nr:MULTISPECIES: RNase adapter RapZ [Isoptericola]MDO8144953.1 RNase adapter RapZ [Isoptericola sp. 178]MDO8148586.1 RNase adapter RapZ [Isoptericola sp. b515]MDO8151468.1 RNase adapter RapZ [Isoptericola sp. b408]NNU26189.1 RNase adapter RapZ [Isoptericola sediminis]